MDKTVIATPDAPAAIGPYSQGIAGNGLVFVSGQLPLTRKRVRCLRRLKLRHGSPSPI